MAAVTSYYYYLFEIVITVTIIYYYNYNEYDNKYISKQISSRYLQTHMDAILKEYICLSII